MKTCALLLAIVTLFTACARHEVDRELAREITAISDDQADPRPHAEKFKKHYKNVRRILTEKKPSLNNASVALAWLYYEWGAFNDAWAFIQLQQPDEASDLEIASRLIWILGRYEDEASDLPRIREEKKRARDWVEKSRSDSMSRPEVRKLCRPETLAHLAAYAVACRRDLGAESANSIFAASREVLFISREISNWNDFAQKLETTSEELIGDCSVIFSILEKTGHADLLPIVTLPTGERRLTSELLEGVLKKKSHMLPHSYVGYHQGLLDIVHQP